MAKLELKNLNKTYNPKVVPVRDVSLTVNDDEFLTLLGPSGCGKSTVLRLIAGLEQPTRGQVLIGDRDVTDHRPGDRNIAMVFQSYALYPHMNVYDNLCSGLKLKKTPDAEIKQRVADAARALDLGGLMERKPGQLSGGQRQRVALGRALVRRPDVFLLDEPLSNLDALLREKVRAELKQLFDAQKVPVVYVTHDQTEAMTLSTKVAVLNQGCVQQLDPPHRIYNQPANLFVAGFVGSPQMNLVTLPCEGRSAVIGDFRIPLPANTVTPPTRIVMGIRPEHIRLANAEDQQTIKGRVFLVENLGMHNLVSIRVQGGQNEPVILRSLLPPNDNWYNQTLTLALPAESLHWFDVDSGDAVFRVERERVAAR
ncbi:MAG TPA: ABC transporter ATP-binding protein [Crinalium sp.]|jgi:multiple sugar transport system ATP-binding protein